MIHPIPPGTRDVLPDEMRELRAITERLRDTFEDAGYGEVWTPALEYEEVLRTGDDARRGRGLPDVRRAGPGAGAALRHDDPDRAGGGHPLRASVEPPLRLCYFGHAYRAVERGTGQQREFLQGGHRADRRARGAEGEAEVIALTLAALDARGPARATGWAWATARCTARCSTRLEVPDEAAASCSSCCRARDLVGLERRVDELGLQRGRRDRLVRLPELRGGPEVLDRARAGARRRPARAARAAGRARGIADRVIFDLGLVRELGYYTGAVFEVYDPAVGFALGGGGRYDDLIGRFGAPRPACGMALDVQRVHIAQAAEEGLGDERALTIAVPRGALFGEQPRPARPPGHRHRRGARATTASCCSRTPAS